VRILPLLARALLGPALALTATCSAPERVAPSAPTAMAPVEVGPEIAAFYAARDFRPLWASGRQLKPAARMLAARVKSPALDAALAAAQAGDTAALVRADLMLSKAYVADAAEPARPPARRAMHYIDPGLAPAARTPRARLEAAAEAPSLASALRRNPAYDGLVRGLELYRATWGRLPGIAVPAAPGPARDAALRRRLGLPAGGDIATRLRDFQRVHALAVTGRPDAATIAALDRGAAYYERLIRANIERARAIPARPGGRMVLVDTASARLWMIEDGRIVGAMRVIVGKRNMETPAVAGMIRYAALNPYWFVPPDLIRARARKVLRQGPGVIAAERLQILSDWSPGARVLRASQVDWRAVASGKRYLNLRQRPGSWNMMGRIKFMFDNPYGVYLHDTPLRALFARPDRHASSGCVRLEDAARLSRWLFRGDPPTPSGAAEQRVDLPEAVPVYITYLTAIPTRDGVRFQPDVYGRDRAAA
jgi:murein L,D-transpeptidase YcbB/YkuD